VGAQGRQAIEAKVRRAGKGKRLVIENGTRQLRTGENTQRYREVLWLGDLDSNQD
jgi:hypothetical protein